MHRCFVLFYLSIYPSIYFCFFLCWVLSRFSRVWLFVTLWTVAHQASQSMGFSWQEYWSGLPFPPPGDLPDSGTEPVYLESPAKVAGFFITEPPGKPKSTGLGSLSLLQQIFLTHQTRVSCILAWEIPWTEEPGRLQSMGLQRVRHDWAHMQAGVILRAPYK